MRCPSCNTEAIITSAEMVFSSEEQKLFRITRFTCRNKKCPKFKEVIGEDKDEQNVTIE